MMTQFNLFNMNNKVSFNEFQKYIINVYLDIDNGKYNGNFLEEFQEKREVLLDFIKNKTKKKENQITKLDICPYSFIKYFRTKQQFETFIVLKSDSKEICSIINNFMNNKEWVINRVSYDYLFDNLFKIKFINSLDDFSDELFYMHFHYFLNDQESNNTNDVLNSLIKFYIYLLKNSCGNFTNISISILTYDNLITKLKSGFTVVSHNPYQNIPTSKKFLLRLDGSVTKNRVGVKNRILVVDSSFINNEKLAFCYIYYIWNDNSENIILKYSSIVYINSFIKILDENKSNEVVINISHILKFKSKIISDLKDSSKAVVLSKVKSFIKFLEAADLVKLDNNIYNFLKSVNTHSKGDKRKFSFDEINTIESCLYSKTLNTSLNMEFNLLYKLIYIAFKIQKSTPLRISTIFSLKTNCLEKISQRSYILRTPSKTKEVEVYNITEKTKLLIEEAIVLTSHIRKFAPNYLKESIFIYERKRYKSISMINSNTYHVILNSICTENNIDNLGQTGIRNLFNSTVSKHIIDNQLNENIIPQITKHSISTHFQNYDSYDIENFCENLYLVKIGEIELEGKVLFAKSLNSHHLEGNIGYCSSEKCLNNTLFDCFVCKYFETTISHESFFIDAINKIDFEIYNQSIKHEKEFLITKKSLLVKYYSKILELKENEKVI